jgi:hypothetical protein
LDEAAVCTIDRLEERPVLDVDRSVVALTCERSSVGLGIEIATHEEFAEGIGLIAVTEELRRQSDVAGAKHPLMSLREIRR